MAQNSDCAAALTRLRREGLEHLVLCERFEQLCRQGMGALRRRVLPPAVMLRLWVLQVVWGNVAINALRQLGGVSFAAASYCQARQRLPLAALGRLLAELCAAALGELRRDSNSAPRVYVADSTNTSMADTPALRGLFGLPQPCRPGVSYPLAMVMGLLDLASGMFVRAAVFAAFVHDQRGVVAVHDALRSGDILVGDRAFCSYVHLALLQQRGIYGCFRLHQQRCAGRLGVVIWSKRRVRRPHGMTLGQFDALPDELAVRIVRLSITHQGYRSRVVLLATTLLDQEQWSDERLAGLYRQRWQIETCFAHLKGTMNMRVLKCRSEQGVLKELTVYLLVYNLVRLIMLRWASLSGVGVWRVSFIDALRLLGARSMGLAGVAELNVNPDRTGRRQLRVRRRRPRHYSWLTHPRSEQPDNSWFRRRR